jgi:nitric oxide reductase large subunit
MAALQGEVSPSRVDRVLGWGVLVTAVVAAACCWRRRSTSIAISRLSPSRWPAWTGRISKSGEDVVAGKALFQRTGLMDFGSLYGNGAYFSPDWTTGYLHRQTELVRDAAALAGFGAPFARFAPAAQAEVSAARSVAFYDTVTAWL